MTGRLFCPRALVLSRLLDLRFGDKAEEAAYLGDSDRHRLWHATWAGSLTCVVLIVTESTWAHSEFSHEPAPLRIDQWDGRWLHVVYTAMAVLVVGGLALTAACRLNSGWLSAEKLVAIQYMAIIAVLTVGRRESVKAQTQSYDWADHGNGDANTLLGLDTALTSLSLSGSLRFHHLLLQAMLAWLMWCGSVVAFGPEVDNFQTSSMTILLFLFAFALSGAWRFERFERSMWKQRQTIREQETKISEQSAMACGMRAVAERFCGFVLSVRTDTRVCDESLPASAFFGRTTLGRALDELVSKHDQERVATALAQASASGLPACIQVTCQCGESRTQEAQLLIADTGGASPKYIVGVSTQHAEEAVRSGAPLDLDLSMTVACGGHEETDLSDGSDFTAVMFRDQGLDSIAELGREEHWLIPAADVRMPTPVCILGKGSYGVVAIALLHGEAVAAKTLPSEGGRGRHLRALLNELRVLRRVRHPNVVGLLGATLDPSAGTVVLVYELIAGARLDEAVRAEMARLDRFRLIFGMSSALRYLHSLDPPIVHSDLKGGNVMVEEVGKGLRAKIIDFGLSRFLVGGCRAGGGTAAWSAPERFLDSGGAKSTSMDVFPFGWLARLTLTGERPHGGRRGRALDDALELMLEKGKVSPLLWAEGTPWRRQGEELCRACFAFEARRRPSMRAIQDRLRTWLDSEEVVQLGYAPAATWMQSTSFVEGHGDLRRAAEDVEDVLHCDLDPQDDFRVVCVEHMVAGLQAQAYPSLGESFFSWLEAPDDLRLLMLSTMKSARSGISVAPVLRRFGGVAIRPPGLAGGAFRRRVSLVAAFPRDGASVNLRVREAGGRPANSGQTKSSRRAPPKRVPPPPCREHPAPPTGRRTRDQRPGRHVLGLCTCSQRQRPGSSQRRFCARSWAPIT